MNRTREENASDLMAEEAENLRVENAARIEIDPEDQQITEATSGRLKGLFKEYFAQFGVPDQTDEIQTAKLREYAETYEEEFGEAATEFERDKGGLLIPVGEHCEERTYDLNQEETLFVHMEDGNVVHVAVISDTSGWCSCEKDHDGPIDYHIEQSWDEGENGEPHGYFVIEGCTGSYTRGDGWMTDDDADFYPGKVRPATAEEIAEHA